MAVDFRSCGDCEIDSEGRISHPAILRKESNSLWSILDTDNDSGFGLDS
jgi:hypothetical protein